MNKIKRRRPSKNYSVLPNAMLQDSALTWRARGLLAFILSLPDDWDIQKTTLHKHAKEGRDATMVAFEELVANRYVVVEKVRNGNLLSVDYIIDSEPIPVTDFQEPENQCTGNPTPENPTSEFPASENPEPLISTIEESTIYQSNINQSNQQQSENEPKSDVVVDAGFELAKGKINEVRQRVLSATQFRDTTCIPLRLKVDYYYLLTNAFFDDRIAMAETGVRIDYEGLQHHLKAWITKQVELGPRSRHSPEFNPQAQPESRYANRGPSGAAAFKPSNLVFNELT